jgi:hypothetical protein
MYPEAMRAVSAVALVLACACGPVGPVGNIVWRAELEPLKEASAACDEFRAQSTDQFLYGDPTVCDRVAADAFGLADDGLAMELLSEMCESPTGQLAIPLACRLLGALHDRRGEHDRAAPFFERACKVAQTEQQHFGGSTNCQAAAERSHTVGLALLTANTPDLPESERRVLYCHYLDASSHPEPQTRVPEAARSPLADARAKLVEGCLWELDLSACGVLEQRFRDCLSDYERFCASQPKPIPTDSPVEVWAFEDSAINRRLGYGVESAQGYTERARKDADEWARIKADLWRMRRETEAYIAQGWQQTLVSISAVPAEIAAAAQAARGGAPVATPARPLPLAPGVGASSPSTTAPAVAPSATERPLALAPTHTPPQPTAAAAAPPPSSGEPFQPGSPTAPPPPRDSLDCTGVHSACLEVTEQSYGVVSYCQANKKGQKTYLPTIRNNCDFPIACKVCGNYGGQARDCVEWYWKRGESWGGWATPLVWCDTNNFVAWCVRDDNTDNRKCLAQKP